MPQAAAPARAKEADEIGKIVKELEHLRATIIVNEKRGEYILARVPDARQRNALLVSYRAEREGTSDEPFKKLVIKVPSPEGAATVEAQLEVKGLLAQHRKTMGELSGVNSVPKLYSGHLEVNGLKLGADYCLIRQFIEGQTLDEWMKDAKHPPSGKFGGFDDIEEWFRWARALVGALAEIHRLRVLHGDLRPENIVVGEIADGIPKVTYVNVEDDAGNRKVLHDVADAGSFRQKYDAPIKLFAKATANADAVLESGGFQWSAPADIYSLGATLFELACGPDAKLEPFHSEKPVEGADGWFKVGAYRRLKRDEVVKTDLLDALMKHHRDERGEVKDPEGVLRMAEVIMGCVRSQSRNQVADIEGILQILDQFDSPPSDGMQKIREPKWQARYYAFNRERPNAFEAVIDRRVCLAAQELEEVGRGGPLRVLGDRQAFLDVMITFLRSLGPGQETRALLTPTFFYAENMGLLGRLTTALQLAQLRGVSVRWLIAVEEHRMRDGEVAAVLENQQMAGEFLERLGAENEYGVRYAALSGPEYKELLRHKMMFVDAGPKSKGDEITGSRVLVAPDYWEGQLIAVLRLWPNPEGFSKYTSERDAFLRYEKTSIPIRSFQR